MHGKITDKALPSVAAIEAEAARVESMIIATSLNEETAQSNLNTFMQLHLRKAEMKAYLAGLRYALGHADLVQTRNVVTDQNFPEVEPGLKINMSIPSEEEEFQLVQCFEC